MRNVWAEIRRRKVVRVAVVYVVGAWLLLQVGDTILGLGDFPAWLGRALLGAVVLGLPFAIALSWFFDITPDGGVAATTDEESPTGEFAYAEPSPLDVTTLDLTRPALRPIVGRARECALIADRLEASRKGHGGILLIGGEPGVGKTRLGEEAIERGHGLGMLPLVGHAYEERSAPFITSTEILEDVARSLPPDHLRNALGPTAAEIALLQPELRRLFPAIPAPAELPPEQQQRFLFNAVLEFLTRLSRSCPLVILLDDLHWADDSSMLLLEHLAPRLPQLPILMVVTYRDVEADMGEPFRRALTQLARQRYATRLTVGSLTRDDVGDLLGTLGGPDVPDEVVDVIFDETDGNAFFVESVYEHLAEDGKLLDENRHWLEAIDRDSLAVPDSVRLVTRRRLSKLSEGTQEVLAIASVLGLRFGLSVLEESAPQRDAVVGAIEEAVRANLIKQSTGGRELRYEFVHALARQTLLTEISAARQQQLHHRIAGAIERVAAGAPERRAAELAYHLTQAGAAADANEILRWSRVAGTNAMNTAAFEEAADYFSLAIEQADKGSAQTRAELLHLRGAAHLSLGRKDAFMGDLESSFAIYESLGLGEQAARVAADIAYLFVWDARPSKVSAIVARALKLLGEDETPGRSQLLSAQGLAHTIGRQPGRAEACHDDAVALARKLGQPDLLADVLQNQALANWQRLAGRWQSEPAREAGDYRRRHHQEWNLGHCLWMEKAGLAFAGQFDTALRIDEELTPLAERNENFGSLACSAIVSGTILQARGDIPGSNRALRQSIALFEAGGFPWGVFSEGHYSVNALLTGETAAARRALETAGANRIPGISWSGCETCYWLSGKAALGDPDVLECFHSLRDDLPEPGQAMASGAVQLLEGSIEALVTAGHRDEAAALYPAIRDFVGSGLGLVAFTYGLHERFAGMAAAAARDWDTAERHFERTLDLAERLPHRVDQARVRYWYARMLLDRDGPGGAERARRMLSEGRDLCSEMGLAGLAGAIDRLTR